MAMMSVSEAAERLAVSSGRVRQRIGDGSLVAQKVGGRWLVDLAASGAPLHAGDRAAQAEVGAGRPVEPGSVWWSLIVGEAARASRARASAAPAADSAAAVVLYQLSVVAKSLDVAADPARWGADRISRSSRERAVRRVAAAAAALDHDALFAWLRHRAVRQQYVAAPEDVDALRHDPRIAISGVSHPASGMEDRRVAEGYVGAADVNDVVADHWLENPKVGDKPNVILHVAPARPEAVVPILVAADLSEHQGPRESVRAAELAQEWLAELRALAGVDR